MAAVCLLPRSESDAGMHPATLKPPDLGWHPQCYVCPSVSPGANLAHGVLQWGPGAIELSDLVADGEGNPGQVLIGYLVPLMAVDGERIGRAAQPHFLGAPQFADLRQRHGVKSA